jgi:hypothetical protein
MARETRLPAMALAAIVLLIASVPGAAEPRSASRGAGESARPDVPTIVLPLQRTSYLVGEKVPLALANVPTGGPVKLEAASADGRVLLHSGVPSPLWWDTARMSPGQYALELDGKPLPPRITLVSPLRASAGAMVDEAMPSQPDFRKEKDPQKRAELERAHWEGIDALFRETGVTCCVAMGAEGPGLLGRNMDAMARSGVMLLVNPDTRPVSFNPVGSDPAELDGMVQRMALTAAANSRYPTFGGFCFGWDTCGYAVDARKMLLVYWGWGSQEQALRNYIDRQDKLKTAEFTKRTGLKPVEEDEYLSYLLSIGRPEFAPYIDLPTRRWVEAIAANVKPMAGAERAAFERRLDAWSAYLMGLYRECYTRYVRDLRAIDPTLRHTASVQSDHAPVRNGQDFAAAYQPLDFRYQSTWNDQVGGPDYAYQWLHVAGLLAMQRGDKPVWISNAHAGAHGRSAWPGKLTRVAAHDLIYGGTGIGLALEGFSTASGGMSSWANAKKGAGAADVQSAKEFIDRFACLAVHGRPRGVGILWSERQYARQHVVMGFGCAAFQVQVSLARLGYSPRYITEDDLAQGRADVKAMVIVGQTVPLPEGAQAGLDRFIREGGLVVVDGSTSVSIPGARKAEVAFPFRLPGKTHNMDAPLMVRNDAHQAALWHQRNAPALLSALGSVGRAPLAPQTGADSPVSVFTIDGGEAAYLVAVNDSYVKTQADWYQVRERLAPTAALPQGACLYDVTEEKALGPAGPVDCDLTATTARVYAILPRAMGATSLVATQRVQAGGELVVRVGFSDAAGAAMKALVPFHLCLKRPDGNLHQAFWRSTDREGALAMAIPMPANAPDGVWSVEVRNQLTGQVAALPVTVAEAKAVPAAEPMTERVVVRNSPAIEAAIAKGAELVVPIADSPQADMLVKAAERLKSSLAARGVSVTIWRSPPMATYTLGYDPNEGQLAENARVDRGEAVGAIKRTTVNANDWFGGVQSGFRFPKAVVLLDLAGVKGDSPLAEGGLTRSGALWPTVDASFPGPGRAVVQAVPWALAPRATAVVVQAMDEEGLLAGVDVLAAGALPADRLTPTISAIRDRLWREHFVGGSPDIPRTFGLTAADLTTRQDPKPFRISFPGPRPPAPGEVPPAEPASRPVITVPGAIESKAFKSFYRVGDGWVDGMTAGSLLFDLRFSEALEVTVSAARPDKYDLTLDGVFRYNDRFPRSQPNWEAVLRVYRPLVPAPARKPMAVAVEIDGKPAGELLPLATEQREVPVNTRPRWEKGPPTTVREEVVTRLGGQVKLPAGECPLRLIHRNIVDGQIEKVTVGEPPPRASQPP